MTKHMAVWLDHTEARVFHFHLDPIDHQRRESADESTVVAPQHKVHRHPKSRGGEAPSHPEDLKHYFERIQPLLSEAQAILVMGPSSAKNELVVFLRDHDARLASHIIGVETVDHPTDPQIVALARTVFRKDDRMRGA